MKNIMNVLLISALVLLSSTSMAQTIRLSGTGKKDLDGIYQLHHVLNGRNAYIKQTGNRVYTIYCKSDQGSSVWMIVDKANNVYYGANANTPEPPQKGWDKGKAGKNLNDTFSLVIDDTYAESTPDATKTITIGFKNNSLSNQRILVRAITNNKEVIRAKTYKPSEIYTYKFETGTEVYLLTEQEGEALMESKGKVAGGRLFIQVKAEDNQKVYDLYPN